MRQDQVDLLLQRDALRKRSLDRARARSMVESAIMNMKVVASIPLTEESAIVLFRETYESIRQLGDAQWWILGYEPRNHEVSMDALKEMDIKEKMRLNHLSRFKAIRNDANYRGFKVTARQAEEIIGFWNACSKDIIGIIMGKLQ